MRIDRLSLENFRGFSEFKLELHTHCTVLAGVNGSGKSSVLDGLAVAIGSWFLGFNDIRPRPIFSAEVRRARIVHGGLVDLEPQYPVRIAVTGVISELDVSWARELRRARGNTTYGEATRPKILAENAQSQVQAGRDVDLPVLAYYGTGRLWAQKRKSKGKEIGLTSRTLGYQDCLDPESNHKLFEAWMKQHEQARVQRQSIMASISSRGGVSSDPRERERSLETLRMAVEASSLEHEAIQLDAVAQTAARCVEGGERLIYDLAHDELRLIFDNETEQSFELLSDGYRNLVALAADIAWRAVRLNPHLGVEAPSRATGVVLIDEIELHLHPAWQRRAIKSLRRAFQNIQFVVTTHSPQVLAGVEAECVRLLDAQGQVHLVSNSEGLDSNTVLRDLMGVPARPKDFEEKLERVASLIESREFNHARTLLDELTITIGGNDPTITALEWELADALDDAPEAP